MPVISKTARPVAVAVAAPVQTSRNVISKPVPKPKVNLLPDRPMEIDEQTDWPRFMVRALWVGGSRAHVPEERPQVEE